MMDSSECNPMINQSEFVLNSIDHRDLYGSIFHIVHMWLLSTENETSQN